MISVQDVCKVFRDRSKKVEAVSNVSFEAKPGEVFGLLGPNGAGKTTLLRMIATSLKPTSGNITVHDQDAIKQPQKARQNMGFLSNNTLLYGRLSPLEVLKYFGRLHGISSDKLEYRIHQLAVHFQFDHFLTRSIDKLSTGMKQKINIARTVIHDPQVVIFDEPTAGLDVLASRSITNFVHQSKEQGKTVIFSTHIMREVERLCDHVAIIHNGSIQFSGDLENLSSQRKEDEDFEDLFLRILDRQSSSSTMGTES